MQVEHFLEQSAARFPEKVALVCDGQRLTYREVNAECERFASLLVENGLRRGDRVAIHLENSVPAVVAVFGTLKAGGVFMPINPTTKPEKIRFLLDNSAAAAFVTDRRRREQLEDAWEQAAHLRSVFLVGDDEEPRAGIKPVIPFHSTACNDRVANRCIDMDLAALIYTSGSTGNPKGVMLTHLNIVSAAVSITTYLENTPDDVIINVLPLSFDYGLYQVLMAFKMGATIVLERSFTYPHAVLQRIVEERVTGFPIVPTIAAILLQLDLAKIDLSSLRYVTNTAAALPTAHIQSLRRALPHVRIYSMYGLTECKRVSYLPPEQLDLRPDSVGRGMPNEEVYVVDDKGMRLEHGIGELVIRGSNVMRGYWGLPEETARVLRPGPIEGERVLHSGDIFRMDEEGYLYFVGRKDDIIKTKGEKVSPKEVENVLCAIDGVAEAAVFGVPDDILGEAVTAVVTLRPGSTLTAADILRHCSKRLEDFMVPKTVEFVTVMPKSSNGKIAKSELKLAMQG